MADRIISSGRGERVIAALDVGSSKVSAIIALADSSGAPRIVGAGQRACDGLSRGVISDMHEAEQAIRAAMDQAERNARLQVKNIIVNINAVSLSSQVRRVETPIEGKRISEQDIARIHAQARRQSDRKTLEILHAEPAFYMTDSTTCVINPLGFHARRLSLDCHVITANASHLHNLDTCVRSALLHVEHIIASPVASAAACLTPEERELGVALVDIGAETTSIAIYVRGVLAGLDSIPMGMTDVTDDIAREFRTSRYHAERLKTYYGAATATARDAHDMLDIASTDQGTRTQRSRAELVAIIRGGLDTLFAKINHSFSSMGFVGPAARQLVLTGGGAELRFITEYAHATLGKQTRIGRPRGLTGLPDAQSGPACTVLAGLVMRTTHAGDDLILSHKDQDSAAHYGGADEETEKPQGRLARMIKMLRQNI